MNILLSFLNMRGSCGSSYGAEGPSSLVSSKTNLDYMSINSLSSSYKHYVNSLGFPKYERLRKSIAGKNTSLNIPKWTQPLLLSSFKRVYQLTIESPKSERPDKGAGGPHPLLYHPTQTSIICLSTRCHRTNIMWIVLVFLNKRGWWKASPEKHRQKKHLSKHP